MNKLTPNAEGIDLLLVNGNQFDSLVLLNSTYEKNDDFVNGFYTESRRLQTPEEGVMLLLRAILALKSSSWIEAWSSCSSVCSTGLAFIRFNEDRWQSIFRSQEASIRYYKRLQTELDNCAGDSNGNLVVEKNDLNEWGEFSDDDFSDSDDDEEDDFTNKPYFEYAEQSNTKHTHTKVLPKFDTREVYVPPKNTLKVDSGLATYD